MGGGVGWRVGRGEDHSRSRKKHREIPEAGERVAPAWDQELVPVAKTRKGWGEDSLAPRLCNSLPGV